MKKLLFVAIVAIMCSSCTYNNVKLVKGQMFLYEYGRSISTFIVKDFNDDGYYCTTTEWLWSSTIFIPKSDLRFDNSFKSLGMYEKYNPKPKKPVIDSTLAKLPIGAKFRMKIVGQLMTFVVCEKSKDEMLVRDPDMAADKWSMTIPYKNFNPEFYKRLR